MEFLVEITVHWPPDADPERKAQLIKAEAARAHELAQSGHLKRLWRKPGAWGNFGLWQAKDATELHELLSSLPFFPWLEVRVHPLARHPSDPATQNKVRT